VTSLLLERHGRHRSQRANVSRHGDYALAHSHERTASASSYSSIPGDDARWIPERQAAIVDPRVGSVAERKEAMTTLIRAWGRAAWWSSRRARAYGQSLHRHAPAHHRRLDIDKDVIPARRAAGDRPLRRALR